jgi:hypothetical protein
MAVTTEEVRAMPSPLLDIAFHTPLGPVIAEGRVLDAVAGRDLRGTLDDIADTLGISHSDLRAAIDELVKIRWISLELLTSGLVLSLAEDARVAS